MNRRMHTEYPAEFKAEAVRRAKAGDRSIRGLEMELGLSANLLRQWVQQYDRKGGEAFVEKGVEGRNGASEVSTEEQVRRLQQKVAQLEEERTILKKVLKLLSQDV